MKNLYLLLKIWSINYKFAKKKYKIMNNKKRKQKRTTNNLKKINNKVIIQRNWKNN